MKLSQKKKPVISKRNRPLTQKHPNVKSKSVKNQCESYSKIFKLQCKLEEGHAGRHISGPAYWTNPDDKLLVDDTGFILISTAQAKGLLDLITSIHNWRDINIRRLSLQTQFMKDPAAPAVSENTKLEIAMEQAFVQTAILRVVPSLTENRTSPPDNGCTNCLSYKNQSTGKQLVVCPVCKVPAPV